ncbi:MAG: Hsp20/alpha crystallin family protein [Anaerolinea sp.]|nr:Hsp20/alpha crystallin family protein [Anaerolinea sp.]
MIYRRSSIPGFLRDMLRFQDQMNRIFDASMTGSSYQSDAMPAMNIYTTTEDTVVTAEVPGVDIKDLEISVVGNNLTISGSREAEFTDENTTYHRQERTCGYFSRGIELPLPVEADKAEASLVNGLLTITLPRAEADKPRRISVKMT